MTLPAFHRVFVSNELRKMQVRVKDVLSNCRKLLCCEISEIPIFIINGVSNESLRTS